MSWEQLTKESFSAVLKTVAWSVLSSPGIERTSTCEASFVPPAIAMVVNPDPRTCSFLMALRISSLESENESKVKRQPYGKTYRLTLISPDDAELCPSL